MAESFGTRKPAGRRKFALIGLAGAVLSGVGDALILGRSCSGREFDHAAGVLPSHLDPDNRWRSLFNGVNLGRPRIHAGTLIGTVAISVLQQVGMRGIAATMRPGAAHRFATLSAAGFAVSGAVAHLCCGSVILAYQRSSETGFESHDGSRPAPRAATAVLAASAAGALIALAVFSASQTVDALRGPSHSPTSRRLVTPFPCVGLTLLTFGVLPTPVGGWARPASMSIGLAVYFAITAAQPPCERVDPGEPGDRSLRRRRGGQPSTLGPVFPR